MYFNNQNNTNIDNEFENENLLSRFLKALSKYKLIIIGAIILTILIILMIFLFTNRKITNYLILNGEENITLYQNTDYIEPGYKAYNSKDEDLTNEVIIESTLDMSTTGDYEIEYKIGDVTKTRIITVIPKPEEYVYIYLTSIDNDINVYLELDKEYVEPGYQAFNTNGEDLTNKVVVDNNVDITKKGIYKVIYTVVDSNGVTISAERIVTVMDTEINLSLSTTGYTNKDINIKVSVIDNYLDYIKLPDDTKVTESTYEYKVSENGTYKFTTYNKKGMTKESTIEVKNIDKTAPTGSCNGSYKDGKSTININAKDNIGISKYIINGKDYTTSKITINSELTTVNVTIQDKAGNTKNISCTLKKTTSDTTQDSSSAKNDPIYTQEEYHDNSINGVRYILYDQADSRWASGKYPSGSTMANSGCMVTTMAVIASAYDPNITPATTFYSKHRYNWTSTAVNDFTDNNISCVRKSSMTKEEIISNLKQGNVVAIKVVAPHNYAATQHYMAIIDITADESKIFIGNKSGRTHGWLKTDSVLYNMSEFHICTPTQSVIDKFK